MSIDHQIIDALAQLQPKPALMRDAVAGLTPILDQLRRGGATEGALQVALASALVKAGYRATPATVRNVRRSIALEHGQFRQRAGAGQGGGAGRGGEDKPAPVKRRTPRQPPSQAAPPASPPPPLPPPAPPVPAEPGKAPGEAGPAFDPSLADRKLAFRAKRPGSATAERAAAELIRAAFNRAYPAARAELSEEALILIEYRNGSSHSDWKGHRIWRKCHSTGARLECYIATSEYQAFKKRAERDIANWEKRYGAVADIIAL